MKPPKIWRDYDRQQEGTRYWEHITNAQFSFREKLIQLLGKYPIDLPGKEFILHPVDAPRLINDLEKLGIAVWAVDVWCWVAPGKRKDEHCPDGLGGPSRILNGAQDWFSEYCHLGFHVSDFEEQARDLDLAHRCNPQVREYIKQKLPHEPGFNEYFRVSLHLYIPMTWDLFPKG